MTANEKIDLNVKIALQQKRVKEFMDFYEKLKESMLGEDPQMRNHKLLLKTKTLEAIHREQDILHNLVARKYEPLREK